MTTAIARSISIRTPIPGPRSRELVARREAAVPNGLYKAHQIAVESASGALVTDVDGNTFIDFIGGIGVLNAGHCPPKVVAAIQAQAAKLQRRVSRPHHDGAFAHQQDIVQKNLRPIRARDLPRAISVRLPHGPERSGGGRAVLGGVRAHAGGWGRP